MSDERCEIERELMAGNQKSAGIENADQNSDSAAGVPNVHPLPRIFQMNIDCFEKLFEWLSVKELLMLRQTSKRFKRLAEYYIRTFYPAVKWGSGMIQVRDECHSNIDQFYRMDPNHAKLIKQLNFIVEELSDHQIGELQEVLGQIEGLEMRKWQIEGEFYESFLKHCPNVRRLKIHNIDDDIIMGSDNEWLLRAYPKLRSVHFDDIEPEGGSGNATEIVEVKTFFELNPNIRTFATSFNFLWENRRWLIGSGIKFDVLKIKGNCYCDSMENISGLVAALHQQGFYKRLHVCLYGIGSVDNWNDVNKLLAVESMHLVCNFSVPFILSPSMNSLKDLGLYYDCSKENEELPNNLMTVQRIRAKYSYLLPLIRRSAKVQEIFICFPFNVNHFIIDAEALGKEREHLPDACNVTVYVKETIFLATKWAGKSTKSTLVEVKRMQASKWIKDFLW